MTDLERQPLDFAGTTWRSKGMQEQAIRDLFDMRHAVPHQLVQGLLDRPEALAFAPMTVRRLQRLREQRRDARSVRPSV